MQLYFIYKSVKRSSSILIITELQQLKKNRILSFRIKLFVFSVEVIPDGWIFPSSMWTTDSDFSRKVSNFQEKKLGPWQPKNRCSSSGKESPFRLINQSQICTVKLDYKKTWLLRTSGYNKQIIVIYWLGSAWIWVSLSRLLQTLVITNKFW